MQWIDQGILLNTRLFGENQAIGTFLTQHHGVHRGLLRIQRKNQAQVQPGGLFQVHWQARLAEHLGTWSIEPLYSPLFFIIKNPLALDALHAVAALLQSWLPEREVHSQVFDVCAGLIRAFSGAWWASYILFEIKILEAAGFKLHLSECALTHSHENLMYVSPRSGRAVSQAYGEPYKDRLLRLPSFMPALKPDSLLSPVQVIAALDLTSYFIERYILTTQESLMPPARTKLYARFKKLKDKAEALDEECKMVRNV